MHNIFRFLTLAVAAIATTAAVADSHGAAKTAAEGVMVKDAYVRAVPPGQPNSAAFMVLENHTMADHKVIDGKSPASKTVELHTHTQKDGMMMMRRIDSIDVSAHGTTTLKPGGLHVMLIGLNQPLKVGDKVALTLIFADGSEKQIEAPVKEIMMGMQHNMPGGMQHEMKHDMHK